MLWSEAHTHKTPPMQLGNPSKRRGGEGMFNAGPFSPAKVVSVNRVIAEGGQGEVFEGTAVTHTGTQAFAMKVSKDRDGVLREVVTNSMLKWLLANLPSEGLFRVPRPLCINLPVAARLIQMNHADKTLAILSPLAQCSLGVFLDQSEVMSVTDPALKILMECVLTGMAQMRNVGANHCDLKPANVVVYSHGSPTLGQYQEASRGPRSPDLRSSCGVPGPHRGLRAEVTDMGSTRFGSSPGAGVGSGGRGMTFVAVESCRSMTTYSFMEPVSTSGGAVVSPGVHSLVVTLRMALNGGVQQPDGKVYAALNNQDPDTVTTHQLSSMSLANAARTCTLVPHRAESDIAGVAQSVADSITAEVVSGFPFLAMELIETELLGEQASVKPFVDTHTADTDAFLDLVFSISNLNRETDFPNPDDVPWVDGATRDWGSV